MERVYFESGGPNRAVIMPLDSTTLREEISRLRLRSSSNAGATLFTWIKFLIICGREYHWNPSSEVDYHTPAARNACKLSRIPLRDVAELPSYWPLPAHPSGVWQRGRHADSWTIAVLLLAPRDTSVCQQQQRPEQKLEVIGEFTFQMSRLRLNIREKWWA